MPLEYEKKNKIAYITLNRPEARNAMDFEMYEQLSKAWIDVRDDPDVWVAIITGAGDKAFCAGADLKKHSSGERTPAQKRAYILLAHETTKQLYEFSKPTIAAVNGPARGAGAEMALNCDFLFMAEEATIAFPETGLGTFVGGGVTFHLPRMLGLQKAKELVYSGAIIDGHTARDMGLALRCFPIESLLDESKSFAAALAEKAPVSMGLAKKRLQQSVALDIETVVHLEAEAILSCMDTEDWHEGIQAFNDKRKPVYKGK